MRPVMTRQNYELIARVLRDSRAKHARTAGRKAKQIDAVLAQLAEDFSEELASTNSKFDRARFERACDPKGEYTERSHASRRAKYLVAAGLEDE